MICFHQLVDLKAELYRKQEQFKREKLGQDSADASFKAKSTTNKVQLEFRRKVLLWRRLISYSWLFISEA